MDPLEPAALRGRRRALGLTQAALADHLAVSPNTIARWERGQLRIGNPQRVERLLVRLEGGRHVTAAVGEHRFEQARVAWRERANDNLPAELSSFVGRQSELSLLDDRLASARLLTLVGPGGVGKTRLALQLAARSREAYPDGVWFVELSHLTEPGLVPSAVASAMNTRERGRTPLVETLSDLLREQRVMLILDNCEHVLEGCAELAQQLLRRCPHLKIVATSRERLRVSGEVRWPVPSLSEAVQLFSERARAVHPDFEITQENDSIIAELCSNLDGLPLAIELAAARIDSIPPRALLQQLQSTDGRLRFLTGGPRDAPARHRTLSAAVAWSYELLDAEERTLFRRLAPFRGCTVDAVELVCIEAAQGTGSTSVDLVPLKLSAHAGLSSLVQKSLLQVYEDEHGRPWFSMLETVREFALDRLSASPDADPVWRRFAWSYLRLAEDSDGRESASQDVLLNRLEREQANFNAAMDWCRAHGYAEASLRLAVSLLWFWSVRGQLAEGRARLESLLARFPLRNTSGTRASVHAQALGALARIAAMQGDLETAHAFEERSLELFVVLEHTEGMCQALEGLAFIARQCGDLAGSRTYMERSVAALRALTAADRGSTRSLMLSNALGNLAQIVHEQGDDEACIAMLRESIRLQEERHHTTATWPAWMYLARVMRDRGDLDSAKQHAETAFKHLEKDADRRGFALMLAELGTIATGRHDFRQAYEHLMSSLRVNQELGEVRGIAFVFDRLAELASAQAQHARALHLSGAAAKLRDQVGTRVLPTDQRDIDRCIEPSRRALGRLADAAVQVGRALSFTDAVAEAEAVAPQPDNVLTSPLSRREGEVVILVGLGQTNRQIANSLVVSESTVATHIQHILTKLELQSRTQIAAWAAHKRLLDEPTSPDGGF
jgi:non-specific serine/threonine protein kinase